MESLLLGGAPSVGKTEAINRLKDELIKRRFTIVIEEIVGFHGDFRAILKGRDKNGEEIIIIINSATDTPQLIKDFKTFFDANGTYDFLISSVREHNFWPRKEFFDIMELKPKHNVLEIPLAKITRRGTNFSTALSWYGNTLDILLNHILSNHPFNIF